MTGKNAVYLSLRVSFGTKLLQAQQAEFMPEIPDGRTTHFARIPMMW
jgi:hypothetical protein